MPALLGALAPPQDVYTHSHSHSYSQSSRASPSKQFLSPHRVTNSVPVTLRLAPRDPQQQQQQPGAQYGPKKHVVDVPVLVSPNTLRKGSPKSSPKKQPLKKNLVLTASVTGFAEQTSFDEQLKRHIQRQRVLEQERRPPPPPYVSSGCPKTAAPARGNKESDVSPALSSSSWQTVPSPYATPTASPALRQSPLLPPAPRQHVISAPPSEPLPPVPSTSSAPRTPAPKRPEIVTEPLTTRTALSRSQRTPTRRVPEARLPGAAHRASSSQPVVSSSRPSAPLPDLTQEGRHAPMRSEPVSVHATKRSVHEERPPMLLSSSRSPSASPRVMPPSRQLGIENDMEMLMNDRIPDWSSYGENKLVPNHSDDRSRSPSPRASPGPGLRITYDLPASHREPGHDRSESTTSMRRRRLSSLSPNSLPRSDPGRSILVSPQQPEKPAYDPSDSDFAKLSSFKPPAPSRLDGVQLADIEGPRRPPPGVPVEPRGVQRLLYSMRRAQGRRVKMPSAQQRRRRISVQSSHGRRSVVSGDDDGLAAI